MAEQKPEQKKDTKPRRFFRRFFQVMLSLLLMAAVYIAAVLLELPQADSSGGLVVVEESEPVSRMQSVTTNDAGSLARLFGAPLPMLPGRAVAGEGGNTDHDGEAVRVVSLTYEGLKITAVRPASAAPLLLYDELSVMLRGDQVVLSQPAVLARKGDAFCAYFFNADAAYAVYSAHADETEFFDLLGRLRWAAN